MLNKKEPGSVEVNFQNTLKESNLVFEDEFVISNLNVLFFKMELLFLESELSIFQKMS